jgi:hypothetical protein
VRGTRWEDIRKINHKAVPCGTGDSFCHIERGEGFLGEGALGVPLAGRGVAFGAEELTFFWRSAITTESNWRVAWISERFKEEGKGGKLAGQEEGRAGRG